MAQAAGALSLGFSVTEGVLGIALTSQADGLRKQELREQQVQLRIQENERSLQRTKELERLLAEEEVQLGSRNIAPGSGSVRAITMRSMHDYYEDEEADRLNYASKRLALKRESQISSNRATAGYINSTAKIIGGVTDYAMDKYSRPSGLLMSASSSSLTNLNSSLVDLD